MKHIKVYNSKTILLFLLIVYSPFNGLCQNSYISLITMDKEYKDHLFNQEGDKLVRKIRNEARKRRIIFRCGLEGTVSSYIRFDVNADECNTYECILDHLVIDTTIGPNITVFRGSKSIGSFIFADSVVFTEGRFQSPSRKYIRMFFKNKPINAFYEHAKKNDILVFIWLQKCVGKVIKYENGKLFVLNSQMDQKVTFMDFEEYIKDFSIEELKDFSKYYFINCNTVKSQ